MGAGLAKQAKTLSDRQIKRVLAEVATHRYPERDRVMVLLSWTACAPRKSRPREASPIRLP
jgi:hypothetical protein